MNESVRQFLNLLNSLPLSKKISMVFVIILVVTGFALMFFWTNQENYQMLFSNLSQRAGEMLKDDLEAMGPVRLAEVEEAQQTVVRAAKELEADGTITLGKGKDDVLV